jgi:sec-independent protein translocase protein TatA
MLSSMPGQFGMTELLVVLVIALIVLGPKKLPEVARSMGKGIREFKGALTMEDDDDDLRRDRDRDPDEPAHGPAS